MKIDRQKVHEKCGGRCGYCGCGLPFKDMQVDHITPKWVYEAWAKTTKTETKMNDLSNLMPSCRQCNHYKREKNLEQFRESMLTLHERLQKIYIVRLAIRFGILDLKPFDGFFYFEKMDTIW